MKAVFLLVGFVATIYAAASLLTGFATDFTVSALVAVMALATVFAIQERGRL